MKKLNVESLFASEDLSIIKETEDFFIMRKYLLD
jgi:hypothetical protein